MSSLQDAPEFTPHLLWASVCSCVNGERFRERETVEPGPHGLMHNTLQVPSCPGTLEMQGNPSARSRSDRSPLPQSGILRALCSPRASDPPSSYSPLSRWPCIRHTEEVEGLGVTSPASQYQPCTPPSSILRAPPSSWPSRTQKVSGPRPILT